VKIHAATPNVRLQFGQRIFFCEEECKSKFLSDPINYVGAQTDKIAQTIQKEVAPEEIQVWCPMSNCLLMVNQITPRVQLVNGQSIFFRCYECVHCFLKCPDKFFTTSKALGGMGQGEHKRSELGHEDKPKVGSEQHPSSLGTHTRGGTQGSDVKSGVKQISEGIKGMFSGSGSQSAGEGCSGGLEKHHHCFYLEHRDENIDKDSCLCIADGHEVKLHPDNEVFAEFLNGQRLFFCNEGCLNAFLDNPNNFLMTAKSFKEQHAENTQNLDGFALGCPICESGRRMIVSSMTPRLYFNYGQLLFFDKLECLETFCGGTKKYLHKCQMKKRTKESGTQQYGSGTQLSGVERKQKKHEYGSPEAMGSPNIPESPEGLGSKDRPYEGVHTGVRDPKETLVGTKDYSKEKPYDKTYESSKPYGSDVLGKDKTHGTDVLGKDKTYDKDKADKDKDKQSSVEGLHIPQTHGGPQVSQQQSGLMP
jgi:YHS domain-containing protein